MNHFLRLSLPALAAVAVLIPVDSWAQQPVPMSAAVPGTPGVPGVAPSPAATYAPGRMIEMRPEEKRPLLLLANERNPYAKRSALQQVAPTEEENAEELRIRQKLQSLSVTGRSLGPNGPRILLGDIIVEKGRVLPPLLEEQSENLQVIEVTRDNILLGWFDVDTGELTGKKMQISFDLRPNVAYALHGQGGDSEEGGKVAERRMGVIDIVKERRDEVSRLTAVSPDREDPGESVEEGDE